MKNGGMAESLNHSHAKEKGLVRGAPTKESRKEDNNLTIFMHSYYLVRGPTIIIPQARERV
jgi:hypothetical protein